MGWRPKRSGRATTRYAAPTVPGTYTASPRRGRPGPPDYDHTLDYQCTVDGAWRGGRVKPYRELKSIGKQRQITPLEVFGK